MRNNIDDNRHKSIDHNDSISTRNRWSIWSKVIIGTQVFLFIIICGLLISGNYNNNNNNSINTNNNNVFTITNEVNNEANELMSSSSVMQKSSDRSSPNIIFVLADDVGWNSIGYENFDLSFTTPFLTELANDGVIISNYYSQEVCTPARAALLTGRYPLTLGMQYGVVESQLTNGLPLDEMTIAELLHDLGGYKTHILGKWHLGHHSPLHLPTARGFDSFLGFVLGENYYWSKKYPTRSRFTDFMDSDTECYQEYDGDDKHTYSTFFYRDRAIEIIDKHDDKDPLFLFLSFQAVHSPFFDKNQFENGIPTEYVSSSIEKKITKKVVGRKRREYAMALAILDDSIESIYDALVDKDLMDNSYFIFASDNGGCYAAGGKNGPLRGTKGSLFEGGVKVDAFVYSSLLPVDGGKIYTGLMHVSDWFPTIMAMASIDYEPPQGKELDGFNQLSAFSTDTSPRDYILYNYFIDLNVDGENFDMWENGSFAIRNNQWKLMHTFNSPAYSDWYDYDELIENDDSLDGAECSQQSSIQGSFTYYLYDLINDPYETSNLYYAPESFYTSVKDELYSQLEIYRANSKYQVYDSVKSVHSFSVWKQHNDLVSPWINEDDIKTLKDSYGKSYPEYCGEVNDDNSVPSHRHGKDDDESTSAEPSPKPTHDPSQSPDITSSPSHKPTHDPSQSPDITSSPSHKPTHDPSQSPDFMDSPTFQPTNIETDSPSTNIETDDVEGDSPTQKPTHKPSKSPDFMDSPTFQPTNIETDSPSYQPTNTDSPSYQPTNIETDDVEGDSPTHKPSHKPTIKPTPLYDDDDFPDDVWDDWR